MCAGASRLFLLPPGPRPPFGGRCPVGADEGPGEASCTHTPRVASRRTLTPTPLPEGEGLVSCSFSLRDHGPLFGGRCSAGADEGQAQPRALTLRRSLRAAPSPQPLSRRERGLARTLAHACCEGRKRTRLQGVRAAGSLHCGRDFSPDALRCAEAIGAAHCRRSSTRKTRTGRARRPVSGSTLLLLTPTGARSPRRCRGGRPGA